MLPLPVLPGVIVPLQVEPLVIVTVQVKVQEVVHWAVRAWIVQLAPAGVVIVGVPFERPEIEPLMVKLTVVLSVTE